MAEGSKVRLVRCPKCENLLQELPDFSVYKCGACSAVLRAKKKTPISDGLSEKSIEERGKGDSGKLESFTEKGVVCLGSVSETERESDGAERGRRKDTVSTERTVNFISSSSPRTENKEALSDRDRDMRREIMGTRLDQKNTNKAVGYGDRYRRSKQSIDNWVDGDNYGMNMDRSELVNSNLEKEDGEFMPQNGNVVGSLRSRGDWQGLERDGFRAFRANFRAVNEQGKFSNFVYPDEGPSNYQPGAVYAHGEQLKNSDNPDGPNRVENLERDRAELLRKLDELKDQLSRSCDVAEKPRERLPGDRRMAPPDLYGGRDTYKVLMQSSAPGKHVMRPPYFNHSHGPVPFGNSHDMDMQNFYRPARNVSNEIPGFEDPFHPQMPMRPPHPPQWQFPQRPSQDYFPGKYVDISRDPLAPYQRETFFHQISCSCLSCRNKNWQVPPQLAPAVFGNRRFSNDPNNPNFYHHVNPVTFGPRGYNPRGFNPQLHSQDPLLHTRRPSDLESDIGGFSQYDPRRVVVTRGNGRLCHPIAGGAPFITCNICFELLQLPRKLMTMEKNQRKVRCGACSAIILFAYENKKLIVCFPTQTMQISAEVDDSSGEVLNENLLSSHGCSNAGGTNSSFDDYDNCGFKFQSMDTEPNLLSKNQRLHLSDSEKRHGQLYSSSVSSEDEESPDSVIVQRLVSNSAELPLKDDASLPLSRSPLRDYSASNHAASRFGKGNKSQRTDQEQVMLNKSTSRQNSVNDASVATEMEVSCNEYLNTGFSQDSVGVGREEDRPRINKGSESFFVGLIKKSFRDFSRSNQNVENGRTNVLVNGQHIPDRAVKKAEKLAGPICPGEYWYDFRAGFWGVIGQPCLGIIPPFIQEFNYPMPENCAAGNTGVYVNGRELQQEDLNLLASRGLPPTRDKSYIVEISGRVVDEESGKELDGLGKLAPTVETTKRGFGMQVPK